MAAVPPNSAKACKNLYAFIRLRIGKEMSDRELARRWDMEWKSFSALKHGRRQVPRIHDLETLAKLLKVEPAFVFEVARGVSAKKVHDLLRKNDPEKMARLLVSSVRSARADAESKEDLFRAILDRATDGVFTADIQGAFREVNRRLCELTGLTAEELLSRSLFDVFCPGEPGRVMQALAPVYQNSEAQGVELIMRAPKGEVLSLELSASRIDDDRGSPVGIQGIVRNTTERKLMEARLRQSEHRWHSLIQHVPDVVIQIDRVGRILYVNRTAAGATVEGTIGSSVLDYVRPEDHEIVKNAIGQVLSTGVMANHELAGGPRDGAMRWYRCHIGPIRNEAGEIESLVLTATDTTEAKALQEELGRKQAMLKTTFDAIPAVCMLQDKDCTILVANRFLCELLGLKEEDVVGRKPNDLFGRPPDPDCPVRRSLVTAKFEQKITELVRPDGSKQYLHRTARPILDRNGETEYVVQIATDVTAQVLEGDNVLLQVSDEKSPRAIPPDREKRRYLRVATEMLVDYVAQGQAVHAETRNLSRGGVFLRTDDLLSVGTEVSLEWKLPKSDVVMKATTVVVWCSPGKQGTPRGMGLRFLDLSSENQKTIVDHVATLVSVCA